MVTLTMNGRSLRVPPGISVLEAAERNDIYIPTLCHHPQLHPVGACRLCLVEIGGMRRPMPSCTTLVAEGMAVQTDSPAVQELRRDILALILSEHPYSCLVCERHASCREWQGTMRKAGVTTGCETCPKNGQCELQVLVEKIGLKEIPYPITYRGFEVENQDPFFDRDYNLCILCSRCIRACQELRHNGVLAFTFRGTAARVGTAFNESHVSLGCEFCGSCVDVCPTGALFDKRTKWEGVPDRVSTTICPYCSAGCQLDLWIKKNRIIGVRPAVDGIVNRGQLCVRGRFGLVEIIHAHDRLRYPMVRKPVQKEAPDRDNNAQKKPPSKKGFPGADGVRLVPTSWDEALGVVAEKLAAYSGDEFAMLVSPNLTNESLYVLQSFARRVMGTRNIDCATALPRYPDLREATLLPELLQSCFRSPIQKIREARSILLVGADPCESHPIVGLQIRTALAEGARLVVMDPRQTDLVHRADFWLRPKPGTDYEWLSELGGCIKGSSGKAPRGKLSRKGLAKIQVVAKLLSENAPTMIIYGSGVTDYATGPSAIRAIQDMAEALGPATGVIPLAGAANVLGALSIGAFAGTGERNYAGIVSRIASGEIKALYLVAEAPPLEILDRLEFLIVQDILPSPNLDDYADVVLPATTFAEMSGTLTNLEGRVQAFDAALSPLAEAQPDWWICSQLAQRMGASGFDYKSSADIAAKIAQEGLARDTSPLEKGSWPGAEPEPPTTCREFPFLLVTARNTLAFRSGSLTERVKGMAELLREDLVTIHPKDAERLGVKDGDLVRLVSANGTEAALARLSSEVLPKMAFASFNVLVGSNLFPARLPDIKACAIRVEKAQGKE